MINEELKNKLSDYIANELEDIEDEEHNIYMLNQVILFVWDHADEYQLSLEEITYKLMFDKMYDDAFDMVVDQISYAVMALKEEEELLDENLNQYVVQILKDNHKI